MWSRRARQRVVGGSGYNDVMPRREEFPNHFVGDLVPTDRGWVAVPPTCCSAGHDYGDGDWSVSSVWCSCNGRHMAWRHYAAQCCTRRNPGHTAESATEAQSPSMKTNNGIQKFCANWIELDELCGRRARRSCGSRWAIV